MAKTTQMKLLELVVLKNDVENVIEYIGKKQNFQFQLKKKNTDSESYEILNVDNQMFLVFH